MKLLKTPYHVYNGLDKDVGKFRTEKQAREFAKKLALKTVPIGKGYDSFLVMYLYREYGMIYEDEIEGYEYKGKVK
jgi:hypothetical protein